MEGRERERLRREEGHTRVVGGRCDKQGNLQTKLVLGGVDLHMPPESSKFMQRFQWGSVTYSVQMV